MTENSDVVLILGSGPNAVLAEKWPKAWFDQIVVINNAWRVRSDWDYLCFPEDFPSENRPPSLARGQKSVQADAFVPAQNVYGGFVFAGATMAFTTAYWALSALRPRVMAFLGCDMVYADNGPTHFYGKGAADPLRDDVTLRDLWAKSARLGALSAMQGCACVNLSADESRLSFPRTDPKTARLARALKVDATAVSALQSREAALGYLTPSGRYSQHGFDLAALDALDQDWRRVFEEAL